MRPIPLERWLVPDTEADWAKAKRAVMTARRAEAYYAEPAFAPAAEEGAALVMDALAPQGALTPPQPTPLETAAAQISDDLVVMVPHGAAWRLAAASVVAPTHWRLGEVAGRALGAIHGPVPGGDPELAARIGRVFSGLRPDIALERFNWTVQAGPERFTPYGASMRARAAAMAEQDAAAGLYLRVERQTIRKLPASGAVLFAIRVCVDPLVDAIALDQDRAAFARAWRAAGDAARAYKGWAVYDRLIAALLPEAVA